MEDKFIKASRLKLRFSTNKGMISIEDLWDCPLSVLDKTAIQLNKNIRDAEEESFIIKKKSRSAISQLKFDIVKYVIDIRLKEKEDKENAILTKQKKEQLQSILEDKKSEALKNKSPEEIQKMIDDLGD